MLRKDMIPPMRPPTEELSLIVGAGERNEGRLKTERFPCVVELLSGEQNPLRITSLVVAPYSLRVQAEWCLIHKPIQGPPVI